MSFTVKPKNEYLHSDIGVFSRYDEHYNPDFYPDRRDNLVNQRIRTNHRLIYPTTWNQYKKQLPLSQRGAYYQPKNRQSMRSKYPRPLGVRRSAAVTPAQRVRAAASLSAAKLRLAATNQRQQPKAKKLNALLKGHTKDANDIARQQTMSTGGAPYRACLTSSTDWANAATGTGLIHSNSDTVFINSVRIKGFCETVQAAANSPDCQRLRQLVVWFTKPQTGPVSGGSLPNLYDVLVTNDIDAMPQTATQNAGSFTILSDRMIYLGRQHKIVTSSVNEHDNTGPQLVTIDQTVQVKRNLQYRVAATSAINGGHYDNVPGAEPGRVEKGLLMLFIVNGRGQQCEYDVTTRLNYTA
jgi:hypothetical protein